MYAVEIYAAVRQFVLVKGNSRREAARVFGVSRDTVAKMCATSAPPGYRRKTTPTKPKLDPFVPIIDGILKADREAPRQQRHTAKRIFERLRDEHGFAGGITIVTDAVREARQRTAEKFVPLHHPPGHAQVDFGEAIGVIGGVRRKRHVFFMSLAYSDACVVKAFGMALGHSNRWRAHASAGGDNGSVSRRSRGGLRVLRRHPAVHSVR